MHDEYYRVTLLTPKIETRNQNSKTTENIQRHSIDRQITFE